MLSRTILSLGFGLSQMEIILIMGVVILLFGAKKLPELGSSVGQGLKNFKKGLREANGEEETPKETPNEPPKILTAEKEDKILNTKQKKAEHKPS